MASPAAIGARKKKKRTRRLERAEGRHENGAVREAGREARERAVDEPRAGGGVVVLVVVFVAAATLGGGGFATEGRQPHPRAEHLGATTVSFEWLKRGFSCGTAPL